MSIKRTSSSPDFTIEPTFQNEFLQASRNKKQRILPPEESLSFHALCKKAQEAFLSGLRRWDRDKNQCKNPSLACEYFKTALLLEPESELIQSWLKMTFAEQAIAQARHFIRKGWEESAKNKGEIENFFKAKEVLKEIALPLDPTNQGAREQLFRLQKVISEEYSSLSKALKEGQEAYLCNWEEDFELFRYKTSENLEPQVVLENLLGFLLYGKYETLALLDISQQLLEKIAEKQLKQESVLYYLSILCTLEPDNVELKEGYSPVFIVYFLDQYNKGHLEEKDFQEVILYILAMSSMHKNDEQKGLWIDKNLLRINSILTTQGNPPLSKDSFNKLLTYSEKDFARELFHKATSCFEEESFQKGYLFNVFAYLIDPSVGETIDKSSFVHLIIALDYLFQQELPWQIKQNFCIHTLLLEYRRSGYVHKVSFDSISRSFQEELLRHCDIKKSPKTAFSALLKLWAFGNRTSNIRDQLLQCLYSNNWPKDETIQEKEKRDFLAFLLAPSEDSSYLNRLAQKNLEKGMELSSTSWHLAQDKALLAFLLAPKQTKFSSFLAQATHEINKTPLPDWDNVFPAEIWFHVFSFLGEEDLFKVGMIPNHKLRDLVHDFPMWKAHLIDLLGKNHVEKMLPQIQNLRITLKKERAIDRALKSVKPYVSFSIETPHRFKSRPLLFSSHLIGLSDKDNTDSQLLLFSFDSPIPPFFAFHRPIVSLHKVSKSCFSVILEIEKDLEYQVQTYNLPDFKLSNEFTLKDDVINSHFAPSDPATLFSYHAIKGQDKRELKIWNLLNQNVQTRILSREIQAVDQSKTSSCILFKRIGTKTAYFLSIPQDDQFKNFEILAFSHRPLCFLFDQDKLYYLDSRKNLFVYTVGKGKKASLERTFPLNAFLNGDTGLFSLAVLDEKIAYIATPRKFLRVDILNSKVDVVDQEAIEEGQILSETIMQVHPARVLTDIKMTKNHKEYHAIVVRNAKTGNVLSSLPRLTEESENDALANIDLYSHPVLANICDVQNDQDQKITTKISIQRFDKNT
ncbi:MAG: hypothetical protein ACM3JI_00405 [Anaerolineae bacterium]